MAINLLSRDLVTSKGIVSERFALGDWSRALDLARSPEAIKVLLVPEAI